MMMELLADPATLMLAVIAVCVLGLAKGGFAGLGVLGTPLLALALPPAVAAAILLPVLLVQDVVSVWSFRHSWSGWIVAWMLPGAAVGVALGTWLAAAIPEARLLLILGILTFSFGLYRLWLERGGRIVAPSDSPGWVGTPCWHHGGSAWARNPECDRGLDFAPMRTNPACVWTIEA